MKDLDKGCTNKWNWTWLEKTHEKVLYSAWCSKLEENSKVYCLWCRTDIHYANTGVTGLAFYAQIAPDGPK